VQSTTYRAGRDCLFAAATLGIGTYAQAGSRTAMYAHKAIQAYDKATDAMDLAETAYYAGQEIRTADPCDDYSALKNLGQQVGIKALGRVAGAPRRAGKNPRLGVTADGDIRAQAGGSHNFKSRPYDRPEIEVKSGKAVRAQGATEDWDDFLGPNQTNIDPRDGMPDPDRIWSKDGQRSVRFGGHEMDSSPSKFHYHRETWEAGQVTNELQRVQR